MPDVVEPGTRLVGRYRLEEHLGGYEDALRSQDGTTYWRAHDELLDRPVGACLLRAGDPHAERVLRAARRAAALTDSRFLRVLDASEVGGVVYVVTEWVSATNLVDLLEDGPLPPQEARDISLDIAAALAAAHEQGLSHLCLQPEHVLRTTHGQVKLAGLGVDAAARGLVADDPVDAANRDTQGAASLLYAMLTSRWPGDGDTRLAAAPYDGDALCSPRQVRAGVPDDLDDVVCRALGLHGRHAGASLGTPDELLDALSGVQVTSRIPVVGHTGRPARDTPSYPPPPVAPYDDQGPRRRRPSAAGLAWAAAGLVLVAGLALFGGQLVLTDFGGGGEETGEEQAENGQPAQPAAGGARPFDVAAATTLDPPPDGNGEENGDRAALAVDGDPSTLWNTETYLDPFGPAGLKDGVGLLLDLGDRRDVSEVAVTVEGGATDLEVRVADEPGTALDDYQLLDEQPNVDGRVRLRPDDPVPARFVLVWLTALPARDGGYRGEVAEVTVRG